MMSFIPNSEQQKAINHPPAPLMIIAGAGTGKTSTLTHRIRHLIETRTAKPENILVLTFTERATDELLQRIKEAIGNQADDTMISTFHGFCNRLVRRFSDSPNVGKLLIQENDITFLLLDNFDQFKFLTSHDFKTDPVSAVKESFVPFFNRIRDELLTPDEVTEMFASLNPAEDGIMNLFPGVSDKAESAEYTRQFSDLVQVYQNYQELKQLNGLVDYGDMILDCWHMLKDSSDILKQVQEIYRHIIIDEYQDNNYALNRIVNLIACQPLLEEGKEEGKNCSITVVGDEDQCIYSFRGANYYNIRDFRRRYEKGANYGEVTLEVNYRSTQEILDLANATVGMDKNRTPKTLRSKHQTGGPKPIWHVGEREQTLSEIPKLVQDYVLNKGRNFGEIAIICRSWSHVKCVARALQRNSVPADLFAEKFFGIPAIKDILAWGHVLFENLKAPSSLFRILSQHLGEARAREFFSGNRSDSLATCLEKLRHWLSSNVLSNHETEQLAWILTVVESLTTKMKKKIHADEMVWTILGETDLLKTSRHNYRYVERLALVNVGHLLSLAESFTVREREKTVDRWLEYMNVIATDFSYPAIQPRQYDNVASVQVMTVHQSKGLEFPVVLIPFLRSGSFPSRYRASMRIDTLPETWYHWPKPKDLTPRMEHLNEERRIFYVAVTRAKEELHLFGPEKAQSIFTRELLEQPNQLMERQEMTISQSSAEYDPMAELRQKLLVELSRELSAGQYDNAKTIIEGLQHVDGHGRLPDGHIYAHLMEGHETSSESHYPQSLHLSASSVEEYDRCPYKYRLSKIDRVPERKSMVQMEFGSIIHRILEEFHDSEDQSLQFLLSLLEKHWRAEAFEYLLREEEFKRQGQEILENYWKYVQVNPPKVVAREAKFDFPIEEWNVHISGKIDRIDRDGTTLTVIDYKTSKNKDKAKNSLQLALYVEALRRDAVENVRGYPGNARLHFLRHTDDPIESHTFSSDDLHKHLGRIEKAANGIRRGVFVPKPSDFICRNCDYREFLCPAWEEK